MDDGAQQESGGIVHVQSLAHHAGPVNVVRYSPSGARQALACVKRRAPYTRVTCALRARARARAQASTLHPAVTTA